MLEEREERGKRPEMATNKRIPKRSIIGSRVSVQCFDGLWRPGVIAAMRSAAEGLLQAEKKFSVRLEVVGSLLECRESEMVGPGFLSCLPPSTRLQAGQVGVTHSWCTLVDRLAGN